MTSHDFQDWQDNNDDLQPDNGQQAAVNTLRDIFNLTTENLPAMMIAARVHTITRAALERLGVAADNDPLADDDGLVDLSLLGVPPAVEVEDLGGRSGLCFPGDPPF